MGQKFGHLKVRRINFGDMFFDVFQPAESKSESHLSQKLPDHEISKLLCLVVRNCMRVLMTHSDLDAIHCSDQVFELSLNMLVA